MMSKTRTFRFLSSAMAAFESVAVEPKLRDFDLPYDEAAIRDAPSPFKVVVYDTDEHHRITCPSYPHDCQRQGCGTTWSTGGEVGVTLIDATGKTWRDAGIVVRGKGGF